MNDSIATAFLRQQALAGIAFAKRSRRVELIPGDGDPPDRYIAVFTAQGLAQSPNGAIVECNQFAVGINFHEGYLRQPEVPRVLTFLGSPLRPWHPNINPPFVCAEIKPATTLVDLLYTCYELWTWSLFGTGDDGLNRAAAQWARKQPKSRFPIDRRPLLEPVVPLETPTEVKP